MRSHKYTNALIDESSPYLLQHAHNPVNWHAWNSETLAKARRENKMMIVSIGYAACHWCHVMEHESFEDEEIARLMNHFFIPVKVDREERPDVDIIYMNAVMLISGHGGWPLNAFTLPDGKPVYAGTYYPKQQWKKVLLYFFEMWQKDREHMIEQANQLSEGIKTVELINFNPEEPKFSIHQTKEIFKKLHSTIDFVKGGRQGAPKFPMPNTYELMLLHHYHTQNQEAWKAVKSTLDNMARGGIYDHAGGGFARYAVDANWLVPHFEKMLYDNAQLVSLYCKAFQLSKETEYEQVVRETLAFIDRELTSPEGAFYSSLDADSEGEEGKFYIWKYEEFISAAGEEAALAADYFNITSEGNWEHGKNILHTTSSLSDFAANKGLQQEQLKEKIESIKQNLMLKRSLRIHPGLDDKILTSWNALMISAYAHAYSTFGEVQFLKKAIKAANFLLKNAIKEDHRITRNFKNGKSTINGFLDDYAFTIEAFLELYQATFDEQWLQRAHQITSYTLSHFFDNESKMFFYTSDMDEPLIAQKMEVSDNVMPASNSVMCKNLYILSKFFGDMEFESKAVQMLHNVMEFVEQQPYFYSNWVIILHHLVFPHFEVAISGVDYKLKTTELNFHYLPNIIVAAAGEKSNLPLLINRFNSEKTLIYVCRNNMCQLPVEHVADAVEMIESEL